MDSEQDTTDALELVVEGKKTQELFTQKYRAPHKVILVEDTGGVKVEYGLWLLQDGMVLVAHRDPDDRLDFWPCYNYQALRRELVSAVVEVAEQQIFTTGEAADICGLSQQMIIECCDNGKIKSFRQIGTGIRQILLLELLEFMDINGISKDRLEKQDDKSRV